MAKATAAPRQRGKVEPRKAGKIVAGEQAMPTAGQNPKSQIWVAIERKTTTWGESNK